MRKEPKEKSNAIQNSHRFDALSPIECHHQQ
jgi:hypothetical protein